MTQGSPTKWQIRARAKVEALPEPARSLHIEMKANACLDLLNALPDADARAVAVLVVKRLKERGLF